MKNPLFNFSVPFAALVSAVLLPTPTLAQTIHTDSLSPQDAMSLMQGEAAIQLNTFVGNTEITEFSSSQSGDMVVGYTATIQQTDANMSVYCSIDLNEIVQCSRDSNPDMDVRDERCGSERPQETLVDAPFTQNLYSTLDDYRIYVYYNTDVSVGVRHLCMNVYDIRNENFIGALPARATRSPGVTAYYSEQPVDGIDYQVILNPDGRYLFRRSQGANLLYEGFSR